MERGFSQMRFPTLRTRFGLIAALTSTLLVTAGAVQAANSKPPINIVLNAPLSGGSAEIGQTHFLPGARAGAWDINKDGGILGRKVNVVLADDSDDPADGIAAINQAIATYSPVAVIGPSSDTALAVDPLINRDKVVDWCLCGTTVLDHMTWPYIFRPSPSDAVLGAAMGYWAHSQGYKRAAFVYMSDPGSQTLVQPSLKTYKALGGKVVVSIKLVPDQPNYRSQVAQILAAHPDVLIGEQDPPTASVFLSEIMQQNGGKMIPMVESSLGASSDFYTTVSKAIGKQAAANDITAFLALGALHSPAYNEFLTSLHAVYPGMQPQQLNTDGYDAAIISALAMSEAKNTEPSVWIHNILSITNGSGPIVHTYAQGLAAIKKGEKPHYVGASGAIFFDKYHNASGTYWSIRFNPKTGKYVELKELTAKELAPFLKFG